MDAQAKYYADKLEFEIDPWDLNAAREAGEQIIVLDTRSPEAYAREHISGAVNIPHRAMSAETTGYLHRSALVVTYCDGIGCNGSTKGALNMVRLGFRVRELIGGIDWWKRDGYSVHAGQTSDCSASCGCA